jgi:hypothetical protein
MTQIYVARPIGPTAGPGAKAYNIKLDSFITIGKTRLHQLTMMVLLCFFSLYIQFIYS